MTEKKSEEEHLLTLTLYENQISMFTNNCFIGTQPNPFIQYLQPLTHCNGQVEFQQTIWLIKRVLFSTQPVRGKAVCHLLQTLGLPEGEWAVIIAPRENTKQVCFKTDCQIDALSRPFHKIKSVSKNAPSQRPCRVTALYKPLFLTLTQNLNWHVHGQACDNRSDVFSF